ncbi:MAG: hypothetical protein ACI802_001049 [Candidatus Paceibacteria bacterium]|jgi:hypothetical protein
MTTLTHTSQFANLTHSVVHSISSFGQFIGNRATTLLNTLSENFDKHQRTLQDDYLGQSTSIADLENRMHDLERRDGQSTLNMMTGMH